MPSIFSPQYEANLSHLRPDCAKCFGFCCAALYFSASEGFPMDKEAGQACPNLQPDYRCSVHENLQNSGFKGCINFDCMGAGQKVAQLSFGGHDWRQRPHTAQKMFAVFLVMLQLHELLWYLTEALALEAARDIHGELKTLLVETENLTRLDPDSLLGLDVAMHRKAVNGLLLKTSELVRAAARKGLPANARARRKFKRGADLAAADLRKADLRGANLRSACLIAADLRECDLSGVDFIGADFRDADIRGANLSGSIFLTQGQLNAARGDESTKLPSSLIRPGHWETDQE